MGECGVLLKEKAIGRRLRELEPARSREKEGPLNESVDMSSINSVEVRAETPDGLIKEIGGDWGDSNETRTEAASSVEIDAKFNCGLLPSDPDAARARVLFFSPTSSPSIAFPWERLELSARARERLLELLAALMILDKNHSSRFSFGMIDPIPVFLLLRVMLGLLLVVI